MTSSALGKLYLTAKQLISFLGRHRSPNWPHLLRVVQPIRSPEILEPLWSVLDTESHGSKTLDIAPKCGIIYWTMLNRHQTILPTFSQLFLNLTLSGVPHLYRQLPNGQYLSDLYKMCYLEANLWKMWTGDHRILTYIFKWERLNTAGHSHTLSIGHWVAPLYND